MAQDLNFLPEVAKLVFSWVILTPVALIVSGKLLANVFRLQITSSQLLRIRIPYILTIQARNDEVVLGFTALFLTIGIVLGIGGRKAHFYVVKELGIDPGQFTAICVISAFITVLWSTLVYIISTLKSSPLSREKREHEALIKSFGPK